MTPQRDGAYTYYIYYIMPIGSCPYIYYIMPIGSCPGRATGRTCSCPARKARAWYAFFPPSHFRHFAYFCAADFTDKRGLVLASVRRALPYAECHKAVSLETRMGEKYFASTGMSALALSIAHYPLSIETPPCHATDLLHTF